MKRLRRGRGERFIGAGRRLWGWAVPVLACVIRLEFRLMWPGFNFTLTTSSIYVSDELGVANETFAQMVAGL